METDKRRISRSSGTNGTVSTVWYQPKPDKRCWFDEEYSIEKLD
jgi:hypothetical protein